MARRSQQYVATVASRTLTCLICGDGQFRRRALSLLTPRRMLFGIEWMAPVAVGLVCVNCGFVHQFVPGAVQLFTVEHGTG